MFLLIFRFSGESTWNHREVASLYEKQQLLSYYSLVRGKAIIESHLLATSDDICEFLGVSVEMCEDRHEKVVWS